MIPGVVGFGAGFGFSNAAQTEEEAQTGKNSAIAALMQAAELSCVSIIIEPLTKAATGSTLLSTVPWLACPLFAVVKQNHYGPLVAVVKEKFPKTAHPIPDTLSSRSIKVYKFLAENTGYFAQICMTLGICALPLVGSGALAAGALLPMGYQAADKKALVPRKVSVVVEKYMPALASLGTLIGGGFILQGITALQVATYFPTFNRGFHKILDRSARKFMKLEGPSIAEIDAPVICKRNMTFAQINAILDAPDDSKFSVNPAHCSKSSIFKSALKESTEFSEFERLFNAIDWEKKYALIKRPFSEDERFIDLLEHHFSDANDVCDRFEHYLTLYASQMEMTKEALLASQLEKQMKALIEMLKGERRAAGTVQDAAEATIYCSQILGYLKTLNLEIRDHRIVLEDILLKLGVEGGEYCARGVKRAACEILRGILEQQLGLEDEDPAREYERRLEQALESKRANLVTSTFQKFIAQLTASMKGLDSTYPSELMTDKHAVAAAQDIHAFDIYRIPLSFGVVPLSQYERNAMGLFDFTNWVNPSSRFTEDRLQMYQTYKAQIDEVFLEVGHLAFGNYLCRVIGENSSLSDEEKEAIIEKFTERGDGAWSVESTQHRFNRLICTILGVLKYDAISDDWAEISHLDAERDPEDWELVSQS